MENYAEIDFYFVICFCFSLLLSITQLQLILNDDECKRQTKEKQGKEDTQGILDYCIY